MFRVLKYILLILLVAAPVSAKYWNGSAWVDSVCNYHDGSVWVPCDEFYYNGAAWVPVNDGGTPPPTWECPDGTTCLYVDTDAVSPSPPTYSTLFDAEAALPDSPTEPMVIRCVGATDDTTSVVFNDSSYTQYGLTVLGDGEYARSYSGSEYSINLSDSGITLDNITIKASVGASGSLLEIYKRAWVRNCTFDGGGEDINGIYIVPDNPVYIYNNVITGTNEGFSGGIRGNGEVYVYNNIIGNITGPDAPAIRAEADWVIQNNIIFDISSTLGAFYEDTYNEDYNTCTESDCIGSNDVNVPDSSTLFVSGTDYHIQDTDSESYQSGTDLSSIFTTDKDGDTRTVPWDCGSYMYK